MHQVDPCAVSPRSRNALSQSNREQSRHSGLLAHGKPTVIQDKGKEAVREGTLEKQQQSEKSASSPKKGRKQNTIQAVEGGGGGHCCSPLIPIYLVFGTWEVFRPNMGFIQTQDAFCDRGSTFPLKSFLNDGAP